VACFLQQLLSQLLPFEHSKQVEDTADGRGKMVKVAAPILVLSSGVA
jgi:hypothetical protein